MRYVFTIAALLVSHAIAHAGNLHNVQFIDAKEGWAVGDDGVILHSLDGGKTWETQDSSTKASLRGIYFFDELVGWVVGREERPYGGGSVGVVLFTRDGGVKWQRLLDNSLPGLNAVRFTDKSTGFLMGDGQVPFPSGLFRTTDGGKSWEPVRGTRTPSWAAGDFQDGKNGVLVGPGGKLATLRHDLWASADVETFGGRGIRAVQILNKKILAVGEGGLVIASTSGGQAWGHVDIGLPAEARTCVDFNCIASFENRIWIAGRPGSVILRSDDNGATWTCKPISLAADSAPLPIKSISFADKNQGWAVGIGGRILATNDGGDTWTEIVRGARPQLLFMTTQAKSAPYDVIAHFGGKLDGASGVVALTIDDPSRGVSGGRFDKAVRKAGGMYGEEVAAFSLPQHLAGADRETIVNFWNRQYPTGAPQELLRQIVLTLRMWQPTIVIVDDPSTSAAHSVVTEAIFVARDRRNLFPEQIAALGLGEDRFLQVYSLAETGQIPIDVTAPRPSGTARDIGRASHAFVVDAPNAQTPSRALVRQFDLGGKSAPLPNIDLDGVESASQKNARERATRQLVNLVDRLPRSEVVLTQLVPLLKSLPDDDAAKAAFNVAWAYVRMGEWDLARETFLVMVDRAPMHPLSAEAYRWLIQHNTSSEVRRRYELKQFALIQPDFSPGFTKKKKSDIQQAAAIEPINELLPPLAPQEETRQWNRGSAEFAKRLALFGSMTGNDPRAQFSLQSARRSLGEIGASRTWHERFAAHVGKCSWGDASAAELWAAGTGPKPGKIAPCRLIEERPILDGKLDEACWKAQPAMNLTNASGMSASEYPTEAWMAYDAEFLYVAVRCKHPAGRSAPPVKVRQRDANLDAHDRVSLLLDLDRDFATYFRLEFDQRGCVREDCWGDQNWNPKWYVAANQGEDFWCVEAAIPLGELTSSPVALDTRWACNLVRIIPGQGVQSISQPADVEPRPEGMCVLHFHQDVRRQAAPMPPPKE